MSEIPSHIATSGVQAGYQAREASRSRDAAGTGQATAAERQVKSLNEQDTTVETSDTDTAVFTDSEGAGSQGRNFDGGDAEETTPPSDGESVRKGLTRGEDGQVHVDLEA